MKKIFSSRDYKKVEPEVLADRTTPPTTNSPEAVTDNSLSDDIMARITTKEIAARYGFDYCERCMANRDGLAVKDTYGGIIFVDEALPPNKKEFVAAHELGHLILGHLDREMTAEEKERSEEQANLFAVVCVAIKAVLSCLT